MEAIFSCIDTGEEVFVDCMKLAVDFRLEVCCVFVVVALLGNDVSGMFSFEKQRD